MTQPIQIEVPNGHSENPTCPYCFADLGDHLVGLYPGSNPTHTGGEHHCPSCSSPIHVFVYYPSPTFSVTAPEYWGDNVTHIRSR